MTEPAYAPSEKATAYHEAGHFVVGLILKLPCRYTTIRRRKTPDGWALGHVVLSKTTVSGLGPGMTERHSLAYYCERMAQMLFAGPVAQWLHEGKERHVSDLENWKNLARANGGESDLARAYDLLKKSLVPEIPLDPAPLPLSESTDPEVVMTQARALMLTLDEAHSLQIALLRRVFRWLRDPVIWAQVTAVAEALLKKKRMCGTEARWRCIVAWSEAKGLGPAQVYVDLLCAQESETND